MKSKITITFIVLELLISTIVKSQNIFDTTIDYYGSDLSGHAYVRTKFENYIKYEVEKTSHFTSKIILASLPPTGGMGGLYCLDTTCNKFLKSRYILFSYAGKNEWTAIKYSEIAEINSDSTTFIKSLPEKLPENAQLFTLRNKWDSLRNDWYLPFVSEIELNGKKGYFVNDASDMRYLSFYAIDTANIVYKEIYENNLSKEWDLPGFCIKNANFDYNYSEPTFAVFIYLMAFFESKTFFPD